MGQAFPIYLTVVGGLLICALLYFAVGQAAANRNGARTAADAAALAAAQERRDDLADVWAENALNPEMWDQIFAGNVPPTSCARAEQLAALNDAEVLSCRGAGSLAFVVEVQSTTPVGESIIAGTEDMRSRAVAGAVVEPRCSFEMLPADVEEGALPQLDCEGLVWDVEPGSPADWPKPHDLFDVHLSDQFVGE
ncbi:pilus assembly protein TadG-related protein [Streptomyces sp. ZYX-F-203]